MGGSRAGLRFARFALDRLRMNCASLTSYALEGNREARRFTLSNAYKDLCYLKSMANAATVTATMASAAKNSSAGAVAQGGEAPEDYVPHLTDFVARANGVK
jgi:3-hydroxyisobutyrate dehydrogenase-like beta-hydroxyacid dehydrogenase